MWVGLDKALRPPPWENSGDGEGGPWILPISGRLIISLGSAWVGFTVAPLSFLGILAFGGRGRKMLLCISPCLSSAATRWLTEN